MDLVRQNFLSTFWHRTVNLATVIGSRRLGAWCVLCCFARRHVIVCYAVLLIALTGAPDLDVIETEEIPSRNDHAAIANKEMIDLLQVQRLAVARRVAGQVDAYQASLHPFSFASSKLERAKALERGHRLVMACQLIGFCSPDILAVIATP